ncbi:MAG: GNAT family N-acetyltransferase [Gammaproteobacteria bacterium]|nr:GNAT family N-acetyltransferase [Gammaproteobacteria bacterium]
MEQLQLRVLSFTELSAASLLALLTLRQEVFLIEQNSLYRDLDGDDPASLHLLLRAPDAGNLLVGYGRLLITKSEAIVGRLVLHADWRRHGLGRQLLEATLAVAAERGPGLPLRLGAQYPLLEWYRQSGFEPQGKPYDDGGILHITMVRPSLTVAPLPVAQRTASWKISASA